jgi:hypothetical protein
MKIGLYFDKHITMRTPGGWRFSSGNNKGIHPPKKLRPPQEEGFGE